MDRFYICIHIDKIYVCIVTHHFLHSCTKVMALGLRQNFVSIQYLENNRIEFHLHIYKIYNGMLHIIFRTFVPELWPLI